ncbi:MAG: tetratricopeptide repeat protein, partial [Chloroflexota bacterium]
MLHLPQKTRPFLTILIPILTLLLLISCQTNTAVPPTPIADVAVPLQSIDVTPTLSAEASAEPTAAGELPTAIIPTVTPLPTLAPTPLPEERVEIGQTETEQGNFEAAITHFQTGIQSGVLTDDQTLDSQLGLGLAFYEEGQYLEAIEALDPLLENTAVPPQTYFYLAQSYAALGGWDSALLHYEQFLQSTPILTAYIAPLMADAHFALGNLDEGVAMLETAVNAPAHRLTEFDNRQRLIAIYQNSGNLTALVEQYNAIHDL